MRFEHTILIVDDIQSNLFALEKNLRQLNAQIIQANNGNDALTMVLNHQVSLLLLDVQMPDMNGFEVAELMRGHNETKHIPIVFITAISREKEHIFKGYELGAVDYILKPVDPTILRKKVSTFLKIDEHRRMLEEECKTEISPSQTNLTTMEQMRQWEREQREEVKVAQQVQKKLLPGEPFQNRGWEIDTFLESAKYVGGDYVDIIPLGDNKVGLVLADVSGHGIPAALITGMIHAWCHATWKHNTQLSEFCSQLNSYLHQYTIPEMYSSIFMGMLNTKSGELEYVLSGHPEPVLFANDKIQYTEQARQPVIGMLPSIPQYVYHLHFSQGDKLLIYSDGLSEHLLTVTATENKKETDLLLSALGKAKDRNPECQLTDIYDTIAPMGIDSTPTDDVTMLMITLGKAGEGWREDVVDELKKRILIIDDDSISRSILRKILEKKGFDCTLAQDGNIGIKLFHQEGFDLVITDIVMPGIHSGYEVLQSVKISSPFTPVILITANSSRQVLEKGVRLGADSYLTKPINSSEILQSVSRLLYIDTVKAKVSMDTDKQGRYQFWLSSNEESLLTMHSFIDALLKEELLKSRLEEAQYCVQEIGRNAIEWGSEMDSQLRVSVLLEITPERILIQVKDHGRGFNVKNLLESLEDFESYQDDRSSQGIRPGGFGLKIVSSIVDEIIFSDDGSQMTMAFNKSTEKEKSKEENEQR